MRRRYWLGVLLGVALLGTGAVVAVLGYATTSGPAGAVRGYFAAVARGDAAGALSFGDVPAGPHTLLTATVLHEQRRIAPLRDLTVVSTRRDGSRASVAVTYILAFPGGGIKVDANVPTHRSGGEWRLDQVAIATELHPVGALERETIVGAGVPAGRTLMFPGAVPISFDNPYLQLDPARDSVSFDSSSTTDVYVKLSAGARTAMLAAIRAKLTTCLTGPADPGCPLPDERYVPGSIRGRISGTLDTATVYLDDNDRTGRIEFYDQVGVTGSYRKLNFHNVQVAGTGTFTLSVHAVAYAVRPLKIVWTSA